MLWLSYVSLTNVQYLEVPIEVFLFLLEVDLAFLLVDEEDDAPLDEERKGGEEHEEERLESAISYTEFDEDTDVEEVDDVPAE